MNAARRRSGALIGLVIVSFVLGVAAVGMAARPKAWRRTARFAAPRQTASRSPAGKPADDPRPEQMICWLRERLDAVRRIDDYTCRVLLSVRQDETLKGPWSAHLKVRHRPLSVYASFFEPENVAGAGSLYWHEKHDGKVLIDTGPMRGGVVLALLTPDPSRANPAHATTLRAFLKVPFEDLHIHGATTRMLELLEKAAKSESYLVRCSHDVSIGARRCTRWEIIGQPKTSQAEFYSAYVYGDDELGLPVRFEVRAMPTRDAVEPVTTAEYTFVDLKLNVGLGDADFETHDGPQELWTARPVDPLPLFRNPSDQPSSRGVRRQQAQ